MTISGNRTWDGILLVGGNLTSNGNNTVQGATITGLNVMLGMVVPGAAVGNGNKNYQYNSCNVAKPPLHGLPRCERIPTPGWITGRATEIRAEAVPRHWRRELTQPRGTALPAVFSCRVLGR